MHFLKNIEIPVHHSLSAFHHYLLIIIVILLCIVMIFSLTSWYFHHMDAASLNFHIQHSEKPAEQQVLHSMGADSEMSAYYKHHLLIMSRH